MLGKTPLMDYEEFGDMYLNKIRAWQEYYAPNHHNIFVGAPIGIEKSLDDVEETLDDDKIKSKRQIVPWPKFNSREEYFKVS